MKCENCGRPSVALFYLRLLDKPKVQTGIAGAACADCAEEVRQQLKEQVEISDYRLVPVPEPAMSW